MQTTADTVGERRGAQESRRPEPGDGRTDRLVRRFDEIRTCRWFWPVALVVGYALEVAFRLVLVRGLDFPSVHPDEDTYLVLSRVLAGRSATEVPVGVVIPGGYPLLISPAMRLSSDPTTVYHLILGINALLNALVFPLAYLALRRLGVRRLLAYVFGGVTALLPPVIFYSQFAMADTVLPVLILAWLLCMHGWLTEGTVKRRAWYAVGMGLAAGYSMATHDRGGVVVAVTGVVLVGVLVLRWAPWRTTLAGLGALGVGAGAAKALAWWLERQFTVPPSQVGTFLMDGLKDFSILRRTLTRTVGQVWYFIVSTWGIGGLAIVVCVVAVFSSRFRRPDRIVGGVMVALLFGTALASAAALPDDARIDDWVYARYTSYLIPAAFVAGTALLARLPRRRLGYAAVATAAFTLLLAQGVIWSAGSKLRTQVFVLWGMPDVAFLSADWTKLNMMRATAAAFVVLAGVVLLLLAGGRKVMWAIGITLAFFACFSISTITEHVSKPFSHWRKSAATGFTKTAGIKPKDNLVIAWDVDWGLRATQTYEVYPGRVWYRDPRWQPVPEGATAVLTPLPSDPKAAPESYWPTHPANWYVDRTDKQGGWVIWRQR
ncbi:phospholipid carrier-dependent glycosyltransferase [Streptomyces sp. Y1]|uniref:Phospholipid carrier-dependent glycosyltransferase n=1 Tax=Streptomyces sp. Y1 TaxID=3238634 RepID=A0AB39TN03_9ACTN